MATTTDISSVLKDLIQINNDRYNGCQKAIEDIQDTDLKDMFRRMGQQSLEFKNELETYATSDEHVPTDETSVASKLHRAWIDVKAVFTGKDRHAVLAAAETGEDTILHTYNNALEDRNAMPPGLLQVVQRQRSELQQSHDMVKALRDTKLS
jgi:uncharacterized protein (TIGR02284 family)